MDQEHLRKLGNQKDIKNELVKQFTKHIEDEAAMGPDDNEAVVKVKLVVVGPLSSGKTSWVNRLVHGKFNPSEPPTVGAKYSGQGVAIEDVVYNFEIWDVSGEEWCKSLVPMYLQYAQAAVVCYDKTDVQSFEQAKKWVDFVKKAGEKKLIVALVGTKEDLAGAVVDSANDIAISKSASRQYSDLRNSNVNVTANINRGSIVQDEEVTDFFIREEKMEPAFMFPSISSKTGKGAEDVILSIAEAFHVRGVEIPRQSAIAGDPGAGIERIFNQAAEAQAAVKSNPTLHNNVEESFLSRTLGKERYDHWNGNLSACWEGTKLNCLICLEKTQTKSREAFQGTKTNARTISMKIGSRSRKFGDTMQRGTARLIQRVRKQDSNQIPAPQPVEMDFEHQPKSPNGDDEEGSVVVAKLR